MDSILSDLLNSTPEGRREIVRAQLRVDVVLQLEQRMEALQVSRKDLAAKLGVSPSAVSQALSGDRNLSLNTLADIANALGLDARVYLQPQGQAPAAKPAQTTVATQLATPRGLQPTFTAAHERLTSAVAFANVQLAAPGSKAYEAAP